MVIRSRRAGRFDDTVNKNDVMDVKYHHISSGIPRALRIIPLQITFSRNNVRTDNGGALIPGKRIASREIPAPLSSHAQSRASTFGRGVEIARNVASAHKLNTCGGVNQW